MLIILDLIQD